jgi:uncharacterized protein (DUF433 family)
MKKFAAREFGIYFLKFFRQIVSEEKTVSKEYVVKVKVNQMEAYRIGDTRVSLDSVVYSWLQGDSPETIADNFPVLTLEEVYGAVAFYLANQQMVDEYLRQAEVQAEKLKQQWRDSNSALYRRLLMIKEERKKQVA